MESTQGLIRFLRLAGRLKKERRKGWIVKVGIKEPESVADHVFRTTLLSMVLGDLKGFDTCKMIKMALIHDLGEAITGDITPKCDKTVEKRMMDEAAMAKVLTNLPEPLQSNYHQLWSELKEARSKEARMVLEIDKLEMAVQAQEYIEDGWPKEKLEEFLRSGKEYVREKELLKLLEAYPIYTSKGNFQ